MSFLDSLELPSQEPPVHSGLDIYNWHIPTEPFETMAQRFTRALLQDIRTETGDACSPSMTANVQNGEGSKRKRDGELDEEEGPSQSRSRVSETL